MSSLGGGKEVLHIYLTPEEQRDVGLVLPGCWV